MIDLSATRAIVTGAGRGIGRAIAVALAENGAAVALSARTASEVEEAAGQIRDAGGSAMAHVVDVRDDDSVAALAEWAPDALGGTVNILVNNAGVYLPNRFLDYSLEEWTTSLDVNVMGPVRLLRAFAPPMLEAGYGRVINIASTAGKYGSLNQSAYNASKHALVGITKCLALEYAAHGIRVNAICPGFVRTDLIPESRFAEVAGGLEPEAVDRLLRDRTPIGRLIEPEEVAALAVYLASPAADAMTGMGLTLAGGLVLV